MSIEKHNNNKKPLTLWLWIELENVISCFITTVKIKWLPIKNKNNFDIIYVHNDGVELLEEVLLFEYLGTYFSLFSLEKKKRNCCILRKNMGNCSFCVWLQIKSQQN